MSRVAKNPIVLPQGVEVALSAETISVKGPLGAMKFTANPAVVVEKEGVLCYARPSKVRRMPMHFPAPFVRS